MLPFILKTSYWIILVWTPLLISIASVILLFIKNKKHFYDYVMMFMNVLLFILISLLFLMTNHNGDDRFGFGVEILFVGASFIVFFTMLLLKLWWNSIRLKHVDTLFQYLLAMKSKILLSFFKTMLLFIVLLQFILAWSGIEAYFQAKKLYPTKEISLLHFYNPFLNEINIGDDLRWSYYRNKYVHRYE